MLERKSGGAVAAGRTMVTLLAATFLAVPAVMLLGRAGDAFSSWLLDQAAGQALGWLRGEVSSGGSRAPRG